jgi:HlyD family secretion protein
MMAEAGVGANGMPEPRTAADSASFAARRDSIRQARQAAGGNGQTGGGQFGGAPGGQNGGGTANRSRSTGGRPGAAQLWYVGPDGKAAVARVRTGLSDGQNTEVIGQNIKEGMQVIIGTNTTAAAATTTPTTTPLQQQRRGPGPGGPGGF